MKTTLTLLICLVYFVSYSQEMENFKQNETTGELYFETVNPVSLSKDSIASKTKEWVALTYNDANHVTKLSSSEKIITKGLVKISYSGMGQIFNVNMNYSLIVSYKPEKYRLQLKDIYLTNREYQLNTPLADYNKGINKNEAIAAYKKSIQDQIDATDNRMIKKMLAKQMNDDKVIAQQIEMTQGINQQILTQVSKECEAIQKSLLTYITSDTGEDDDW